MTDRQAIEAFVQEHEAFVRTLAARLSPFPAEADDIAQEALVIAFQKHATFDPDRDPRAWLAGIVRNLSHRAWDTAFRTQRLKRDALADYLQELAQEPSELYDEPSKEALRKCLEKLPEKSRTLLNLRYNLGHESDAIGARFAATGEAIRMTLARIRKELRGCIGKTLAEGSAS